jgi:anti-sigma regulatory factor (Ser/Thr protein kinase)
MTVINWVRRTSQVGEAWRTAAAQGRRKGIAQDVEARMALVATEIAINLVKHAGGGLVAINGFPDADRSGIEPVVLAKGRAWPISRAASPMASLRPGAPAPGLAPLSAFPTATRSTRAPVSVTR